MFNNDQYSTEQITIVKGRPKAYKVKNKPSEYQVSKKTNSYKGTNPLMK